MVSEAPLDELESDDDLEEEVEESEEELEEQPEDELGSLRETVARLEQQLERPSWLNDLKTIQGRMSAIEARFNSTNDTDQKSELLRELRAESGKSEALLSEILSGLDESAFTDPSVKTRAAETFAQRREQEARAALRDEILAELKPEKEEPKQQAEDYRYNESVRVWENTWEEVVTDAGLDPDSEDLLAVWQGVSPLVAKGDYKQANAFMKQKLQALKGDIETATKRQNAKNSGGRGAPKGAGGGKVSPMDSSRSSADRIAHLRSIGAL